MGRALNLVSFDLRFTGKYDLTKLERLRFERIKYRGDRYFWKFWGVLHKYTVIPVDDNHIRITIYPKAGLPHPIPGEITLGNMNGWVKSILDTISGSTE